MLAPQHHHPFLGPFNRRPFNLFRLDPIQQILIDASPSCSILLTGEAGFGKTTVALHRAARLYNLAKRTHRSFKGLVLAPNDSLVQVLATKLRGLGADFEVSTFDRWAQEEGRHSFTDVPARNSVDATESVIRFKRHPAVRVVLDQVPIGDQVTGAGLFELWGDRHLLGEIVAASNGTLTRRMAQEVYEHACVQFAERCPEPGLFGQDVEDGTPMQDAQSVDVEDFPVLFELDAHWGGRENSGSFDHIFLDEAQELAPMELSLIGRALRSGGSITVAGDANQQVDPTAFFAGWEQVLVDLGQPNALRGVLNKSYRCPPDIIGLANATLNGEPVEGGAVLSQFDSYQEQIAVMARELRELRGTCQIAIITRTDGAAQRMAQAMRRHKLAATCLSDESKLPPRGVCVASIGRIKGMEFDLVVIPDLTPEAWPDEEYARRALYVAITRATQRVWMGTVGLWSPLLRVPQNLR